MSIDFLCPHCQRTLRVPDDAMGRGARCPECSQVSEIPATTTPAAAKPQAVASPQQPRAPESTDPFLRTPRNENPYAAPYGSSTQLDHRVANPFERSPLASRGRRLLGAIVDGLVRIGIVLVAMVVPLVVALTPQGQQNEELIVLLTIVFAMLGALAGAAINWYLIAISGQSIAKRWLGMRIVKADDEGLPGFLYGVLLRMWVPFAINQACGLFSFIDVLFIFGEDQKCIHDYIASTNVIDVATERRYYPLNS